MEVTSFFLLFSDGKDVLKAMATKLDVMSFIANGKPATNGINGTH